MYHPHDAYDRFEEISALVKKTHLEFKDPRHDYEVNATHAAAKKTERDEWIIKSKNLLDEVSHTF